MGGGEANGTFGAFVRLLLLTGQRRDKVAAMRWPDVSIDGAWTIPGEDREKGNARRARAARSRACHHQGATALRQQSIRVCWSGRLAYQRLQQSKAAFDAKLARDAAMAVCMIFAGPPGHSWRALASSDLAERVLGHVIKRR